MQTYLEVFGRLPTMLTRRLILRPVRMSDAQDLYEYSRDPEVARHVLWDAHRSIHQTRAYIRYLLRQYRSFSSEISIPSTLVSSELWVRSAIFTLRAK